MTSSSAASLSAVLQNTSLDDHEDILKAANNALKKSKSDLHAQHIRLIALVKLDRYDDALCVLDEGGDALKEQAPLPCAYTLYKVGRLQEAEEVASRNGTLRGFKHVRAQVAYRSEKFDKAADLYEDLSGAGSAEAGETSDLRVNSRATDAQLGWLGLSHLVRKSKPDREDLEQFETVYNSACGYIARGELRQAELLLGRAKDLCNAADELSDDDKASEVLPITIQQIYVLSRLGRLAEADSLCSAIDVSGITDQALKRIAQANVLQASRKTQNPYLSQRLFQLTSGVPAKDLPFTFQSSILCRNAQVLDLEAGKTAGVAQSTLSMISSHAKEKTSVDVASAGVFNAAAHARNQHGKAALKQLLPILEQRPTDVGLLLTILQIYVLTNNANTATSLLDTFLKRLEHSDTANQDARFAPGIVAVLVSLHKTLGRNGEIKAELAKAAAYWREKAGSRAMPVSLLKGTALALLDCPTPDEVQASHELFKLVHSQDPLDRFSIAGVAASAPEGFDETLLAPDAWTKLPATEKMITGIDSVALDGAGIARSTPRPAPPSSKKRGAGADAKPEKAKKARKTKLPKDYDPSKKPDPERWLPLRDRSNWRPKGKKKGRVAGNMATQGGIVSEDSRPSTPSQSAQSVLQQQTKPGSKTKKKKPKGGK